MLLYGLSLLGFLVAVGLLASTIVITKNKTVNILETFGKYSGTREAGISFKLPAPFQTVVETVPMYIQEIKTPLELKTSDDLFIQYPVTVQFKVTDPVKATYELEDPENQIMSYVRNLVRSEVGKKTFLELYGVRDELQEEIQKVLAEKLSSFGFEIVDVLVDQPIPTEEVQASYNSVTSSAREKEAAKNRAEATRITLIAEAEAQKESKRLQGEGIAEQRTAIAKGFKEATEDISTQLGISNEMAVMMILQLNKYDTLRDASNGKGTIIITDGSSDSEMKSMNQMVAGVKAALKNTAEPIDKHH